MECKKCGTKWETGKKTSESLIVCPFCRESLPKKEEPKFYENSRDALAAIMKMYGVEVLLGKLTSHFPDFAPDVSKNVKKLVYAVYENDAAKVLKNNLSASQSDKERAVKVAIQKLMEAFIVPDMAEIIIYEFTAALGWQVGKPDSPPQQPYIQPQNMSNNDVTYSEPVQSSPRAEKGLAESLRSLTKPVQQESGLVESLKHLAGKLVQSSTSIQSQGRQTSKLIYTPMQTNPQQQAPSLALSANAAYPTTTGIATEILRGEKRNLQFGNYKWRVLNVQGRKALMITEDIVEQSDYNETYTSVTWETCTLRRYLNKKFLQKFTVEERGKIVETWIGNPDNLWSGTKGGNNTSDKIFLLSLEDVDRYFGNSGDYQQKRRKTFRNSRFVADSKGWFFPNIYDGDRQAKFGNITCWWWLRTPGSDSSYAALVGDAGIVYVSGSAVVSASGGVRPAIWLNLKY